MARKKAEPITPERLAQSGSEDGEQMALFCWLAGERERCPDVRWAYHVPNGGSRQKAEAGKLKAMGVKKGVSDVHWPVRRGNYVGLVIEMKRKDGVPSDVDADQKAWLNHFNSQGYRVHVAFGWEEARDLFIAYDNLGSP